MNKSVFKIGLILSIMVLLPLCTTKVETEQNQTTSNKKTAVFEKFDVETENIEIDAEKGKKIILNTGSTINIPADAFVDKSGKTIKGKVNIKFREFHTLADILASGINMQYDSAGKKYNFESAGMFQIDGKQNNQPIFINQSKGIEVNLASQKDGDFNFYQLTPPNTQKITLSSPFISKVYAQDKNTSNIENEKWKLLATNLKAKPNEEKQQKIKELQSQIPIKPIVPQNFDEKEPALDFDINTAEFPELKEFEGVIWQYAGDKNAKENPNKKENEWIFRQKWANVNLEIYDPSNGQYKLNLTNGNKSFSTIIKPALRGVQLEKAKTIFAQKMEAYKQERSKKEEFVKKTEEELEKIKLQGDFKRAFTILIFGTYNWDRIYPFSEENTIVADFSIKGASKDDIESVYLIIGEKTSCVNYQKGRWNNFKYAGNESNQIIAVLKNDKIATFSKSKFETAKDTQFKKGQNFTFDLELQADLTSLKDLHNLIKAN